MAQIGVFDIVGPIMVGPSSSHTAGAVRLGLASMRILGEPVRNGEIFLHGSFAATYWGHRTDIAIIAGLLGMSMSDSKIPQAKEIAKKEGLEYSLQSIDLGDVHPNSVRLRVAGENNKVDITGASIGGGRIRIYDIDGFPVAVEGLYSALLVRYRDEPGVVAEVTRILADYKINIAYMDVSRKMRGSDALIIAETDDPIPAEVLQQVKMLRKNVAVRSLPCF